MSSTSPPGLRSPSSLNNPNSSKKNLKPWGELNQRDTEKGGTKRKIPLHSPNIIVGRSQKCDVVIDLNTVSRQHYSIYKCVMPDGEIKAIIRVLSEKGSVYVNYKKLTCNGMLVLHHQDKIAVGGKAKAVYEFNFPSKPIMRKRDRSLTNVTDASEEIHHDKRAKHHHHTRTLRPGLIITFSEWSKKKGADQNKTWEVHEFIGQGTFSEVYRVVCKETEAEGAIKVEKKESHHEMLTKELGILKELQKDLQLYVCEYLGSGHLPKSAGGGLFVCMELCRISVSEYRKQQKNQRLSQYEGASIAQGMLRALQAVHDLGYLHRDIKPSNFMLPYPTDRRPSQFACVIVDFGLCKKHIINGKVVKPRSGTSFKGTSLYASLQAHRCQELGRRDDLWSLLFVIIDCINGGLPWRQCSQQKDRNAAFNKKQKYCGDGRVPSIEILQKPLQEFMRHLHTLQYESKPNYKNLHEHLQSLADIDKEGKEKVSRTQKNGEEDGVEGREDEIHANKDGKMQGDSGKDETGGQVGTKDEKQSDEKVVKNEGK